MIHSYAPRPFARSWTIFIQIQTRTFHCTPYEFRFSGCVLFTVVFKLNGKLLFEPCIFICGRRMSFNIICQERAPFLDSEICARFAKRNAVFAFRQAGRSQPRLNPWRRRCNAQNTVAFSHLGATLDAMRIAMLACEAATVGLLAVVLLGAFWRPWDWRAPVFVILLVAALYLPFLNVGSGVIGFIPTYLHEEGFVAGSGFWLVSLVRRPFGDVPGILPFYLSVGAMGLGLATLRILFKPACYRSAEQIRDAVVLLFIGLFVLSPNYPWYYLPLIPFLADFDDGLLWATTLLASPHHIWWPTPDDQPTRFLIWKTVLNLGSIVALLAAWLSARRRTARQVRDEPRPLSPAPAEPAALAAETGS